MLYIECGDRTAHIGVEGGLSTVLCTATRSALTYRWRDLPSSTASASMRVGGVERFDVINDSTTCTIGHNHWVLLKHLG